MKHEALLVYEMLLEKNNIVNVKYYNIHDKKVYEVQQRYEMSLEEASILCVI